MEFGRIFVGRAIFVFSSRDRAPMPGCRGVKMFWRGVRNRLDKGDRFSGRATLNEVQFCLHAMLRRGGFSAYPVVFGADPVDLCMWQDGDSDPDPVQAAPILG